MSPQWSHLIRFQGTDDEIHFGDAILENPDTDIGLLSPGSTLKARLIRGNPLTPACQVTQEEVEVKKLLGPLTPQMVPSVRCIGLNYLKHIKEGGRPVPPLPSLFLKTPRTIADYGCDVEIPKIAQDSQADYEGELTVVISKDCKNVSEEDALDYVLGYCAGDDVSSRKWQRDPKLAGGVPQWSFSKSFDMYAPLGPCITSSKLLPNPDALRISTKINGSIRQDSNTSDMLFSIPKLIAFLSQGTTLEAGSVIMTGTPEGVGYAMKGEEGPQFLKPGDRVEVFVEGVGSLVHGISYA